MSGQNIVWAVKRKSDGWIMSFTVDTTRREAIAHYDYVFGGDKSNYARERRRGNLKAVKCELVELEEHGSPPEPTVE